MNTITGALPVETMAAPKKWGWRDLGFGAVVTAGAAFATQRYSRFMDVYELVILWSCVPVAVFLGFLWSALRPYMLGIAAASLMAIGMYGGSASAVESNLLLKYFLSSQSAILWMCALFGIATAAYWVGLFAKGTTALWMGSLLTWSGAVM